MCVTDKKYILVNRIHFNGRNDCRYYLTLLHSQHCSHRHRSALSSTTCPIICCPAYQITTYNGQNQRARRTGSGHVGTRKENAVTADRWNIVFQSFCFNGKWQHNLALTLFTQSLHPNLETLGTHRWSKTFKWRTSLLRKLHVSQLYNRTERTEKSKHDFPFLVK